MLNLPVRHVTWNHSCKNRKQKNCKQNVQQILPKITTIYKNISHKNTILQEDRGT